MSASLPVERAAAFLETAGYTRVREPLFVASIPFEFDATLVGSASLDLILVVDLIEGATIGVNQRRIEGLARALDVVGSKRSLTIVLVGPLPPLDVVNALSGVGRILSVDTGSRDKDVLRDSLSVLLPLSLDHHGATLVETGLAAVETIRRAFPQPPASEVLLAGRHGARTVRATAIELLDAAIRDTL